MKEKNCEVHQIVLNTEDTDALSSLPNSKFNAFLKLILITADYRTYRTRLGNFQSRIKRVSGGSGSYEVEDMPLEKIRL